MLRLSVLLAFLGITFLYGNNLRITNVSVSGSNISFNISWENSWRITNQPPFNWDAVWVIVKRRDCASTDGWRHVKVSSNKADHTAGAPLTIETVPDQMGVFIHLNKDTAGHINNVPITLKMVGVPTGVYDFKVIGIEMVYIPQGSFWVGDAASGYRFYRVGTTGNAPYQITSEGSLSIANANGRLWALSNYATSQTLPAYTTPGSGFPKGFAAFYVMKYEITQGQYVDFLNSLSADQAAARGFTINANRINISGSWPNFTTNFPHRAMGNLSWDDLAAYLDWVALAPMTELDYEKICRGPRPPVALEYAWGTTAILDANTLINDGTPTETHNISSIPPGTGVANYGNNSILGPVRVGFAAKPGTTREQAGASYYGVMELSGNLYERVIVLRYNVSYFRGRHGDGEITTTLNPPAGRADVPDWPTNINAVGVRGGGWNAPAVYLRVSERRWVTDNSGRSSVIGGRGLRRVY